MNQPQWISLYIPGAEPASLAGTVEAALASAGATKYDPFGAMPGLSYPRAVKLFVAPKLGDWVRIIVSPDCVLEPVVTAASLDAPVIAGFISSELIPALTFYRGGDLIDVPALSPYLTDTAGFASHLRQPKHGASGVGGVSSGALPADLRAMSGSLSTRQVERMMNSMTGAISKGDRASAQAALQSIDWESGAGEWMRTALAYFGLHDAVQPDYATVSTALRTAKRLARNPKATLYPGDAEARDAVPNVLDYVPVFYGWKP
jgi:hypothetical protein